MKCAECGSESFELDGYFHCRHCGLVMEEMYPYIA